MQHYPIWTHAHIRTLCSHSVSCLDQMMELLTSQYLYISTSLSSFCISPSPFSSWQNLASHRFLETNIPSFLFLSFLSRCQELSSKSTPLPENASLRQSKHRWKRIFRFLSVHLLNSSAHPFIVLLFFSMYCTFICPSNHSLFLPFSTLPPTPLSGILYTHTHTHTR